jgi:thymidylate kinase
MKKFVVIEGDNGTGKDTLAKLMETLGYNIITYTSDAKYAETKARNLCGEDKLQSFLEYNKMCGSIAESSDTPSLLIRYWISTLAAAYADQLWMREKVNTKIASYIAHFPTPSLVIQLKCAFSVRKARIKTRGPSDDNMCLERDIRYSWALDEIRKHFTSWEVIDTTAISQLEVFQVAQEITKPRGL